MKSKNISADDENTLTNESMFDEEVMDNEVDSTNEESFFDENGDLIAPNKHMESVAYLEKAAADRLIKFLKYSGIELATSEYDDLNGSYDVQVSSMDFEKAKNLFHVFSENELPETDSEDANQPSLSAGNLYENSTEKYKDNLSSAVTFLICGVAGLIILLLNDFGILHLISASGASFILMNAVIGGMFLVFIIIGFISFKYSKNIKQQVNAENEANSKISVWLHENVPMDVIEDSYDNSIPEEMKYFSRSEYIKNAIHTEFDDITDEIAEVISDHYIEELFGSADE